MFRQPSSIETPTHFLQGLYESRVRYNEYNGSVSALGRQKLREQILPKRGKKLAVEAFYREQDWEFKVYDIHEKVLRWFKLSNTYKIYEIQDYIPVSSNIYGFWVRNFSTKQGNKQQQCLLFFSIPHISESELMQQNKKIELTLYKQHPLQICRVEEKQIQKSDFFTQTRQISYVHSLKCLRLVWKFSNKQGGVFLVNLLQGPASVKPKSILRIEYIPIREMESEQKFRSWTFYTGFRNLFGSYLIIDPKELNEKSYCAIMGETEQKCPLTVYRPMVLVYHPVSQLPNHMLEQQNERELSFIMFITNQKKFKWPNHKYISKIMIVNYLLALDDDEQTESMDVNEVLTSLTISSQQSSQSNQHEVVRLTGITMHENKYRILKIQINVGSSNGSVTCYSEHKFKNICDRIFRTYDIGGYVINCICQKSYICHHNKDKQNELVHEFLQNECVGGNRYLVEQNMIYIYFFNQASHKYEIMNNFIIPNSANYHDIRVHYDRAKNLRIFQHIDEEIYMQPGSNKNLKEYMNIIELANKKLLYMQILQQIYTKQNRNKQTTQPEETMFIENIAKYMLQLL